MKEPNWLSRRAIIAVHKMLVAAHGGDPRLRDPAFLKSALARPVKRFADDPRATLFDLAAGYAFGLIRNHPFVAGNKRIGATAIAMFLEDNGFRFVPEGETALLTCLAVAAGEMKEDALARAIGVDTEPA